MVDKIGKTIEKFSKELLPVFFYEDDDLYIELNEYQIKITYRGKQISSFIGTKNKRRFWRAIR